MAGWLDGGKGAAAARTRCKRIWRPEVGSCVCTLDRISRRARRGWYAEGKLGEGYDVIAADAEWPVSAFGPPSGPRSPARPSANVMHRACTTPLASHGGWFARPRQPLGTHAPVPAQAEAASGCSGLPRRSIPATSAMTQAMGGVGGGGRGRPRWPLASPRQATAIEARGMADGLAAPPTARPWGRDRLAIAGDQLDGQPSCEIGFAPAAPPARREGR